jgi:hypothetical protein
MMIFNLFVGWNNGHNRSFRMTDLEADIEQVSVTDKAQYMIIGNGDRFIMGVEDTLETRIFGEGH